MSMSITIDASIRKLTSLFQENDIWVKFPQNVDFIL